MPNMNYEDVSFVIEQDFGTLPSRGSWKKKVRLIRWGDNTQAKLDIRPWNSDDSKWGKGISLSAKELQALKEILEPIQLS